MKCKVEMFCLFNDLLSLVDILKHSTHTIYLLTVSNQNQPSSLSKQTESLCVKNSSTEHFYNLTPSTKNVDAQEPSLKPLYIHLHVRPGSWLESYCLALSADLHRFTAPLLCGNWQKSIQFTALLMFLYTCLSIAINLKAHCGAFHIFNCYSIEKE